MCAGQASDEIWGLPLQPVEAAANMLIARVGFDLLRSPAFQTAASAYVQKKLDQLRLPPYIGPLKARSVYCCQLIGKAFSRRLHPPPGLGRSKARELIHR